MDLPVQPPLQPMLAKAASTVPPQRPAEADSSLNYWSYEPKWDGFRAIVFKDGDEVIIGSRSGKDLARYFPELVTAFKTELPKKIVLDGEIGVPREFELAGQPGKQRLSWEALSQRIHPAASRVNLLAEETPAIFIGFDALATGTEDLTGKPFSDRRIILQQSISGGNSCFITRTTEDASEAEQWFSEFEGAGLDGVVAKKLAGAYLPNKRELVKIKHKRTADAVVIGYRIHKSGTGIGSLLLGLYADDGELKMVGGIGAFSNADRISLQLELDSLRTGEDAQGEINRWKSSADASYIPLRPERVVEVSYDQMENNRFRHAVTFLRWRVDREPQSCGYDQLEVPLTCDLNDVLVQGI